MMVFSLKSALSALFFVSSGLGLEVSPNSPCISLCLDNPSQNISGSTASTFGSEISCLDDSFANSPVGKKYMSCVSCLQTSTSSSSTGNDQGWFLYNLRYTVDSCLFGFSNATDAISTLCSTSESCGPLQSALENGNLIPNNESDYSYCSADNNAFLGAFLPKCISCLRSSTNEQYLANFLVALQAGCLQRVPVGTLIGIQGSIFSSESINITYPGYNQTQTTTTKSKLSRPAIIGIAVGLAALFLTTVVILIICTRKQKALRRARRYQSPLDSRFGAPNITAPTDGAYGDPYSGPLIKPVLAPSFDTSNLTSQELAVLKDARAVMAKHSSSESSHEVKNNETWPDVHAQLTQLPPYNNSAIPTHQAYIPPHGLISPASSAITHITNSATPSPAYITSGQSSARTSPPILVPRSNHISPPPQLLAQPSEVRKIAEAQITELQQHQQQQQLETRPPSRTQSRAESFARGTLRIGIGSAPKIQTRTMVSSPIHNHSGRFDFELAEREKQTKEGKTGKRAKKDPIPEPQSAESPEQWPGSY